MMERVSRVWEKLMVPNKATSAIIMEGVNLLIFIIVGEVDSRWSIVHGKLQDFNVHCFIVNSLKRNLLVYSY